MPGFDKGNSRIPSGIGDVEIVLFDRVEPLIDAGSNPIQRTKGGAFRIRVLDQDGELLEMRRGDLKAHLVANAPAVAQQLRDLLDWVRTEANDRILPLA